ncbi:MAG: HAD family hydrolase [Candidatus Sulfotelmatobacter sp.]
MSDITVTDIMAVVFDFDDTLMPDTTTALLSKHGIRPEEFWPQARALIDEGYDQPSAYLRLLLDNVGESKPLGKLTNRALSEFGGTLDGEYYRGLPAFFDDLRNDVEKQFKGSIKVEYYIISGGLQSILRGNGIVAKYFSGVYGCILGESRETGLVTHIKRSITFTEKTRYLFEINKGVKQEESDSNPFLVNEDIPQDRRRIPFQNIVYVGDGLTDIPCFSTVKHFKGKVLGIFDPTNSENTKRAIEKFLVPTRVMGVYKPEYGPTDQLGSLLRSLILTRASEIALDREIAKKVSKP